MRPRPILVLLATLQFTACATWKPVSTPPREYVESARPTWVRVHDALGNETVLKSPSIRGDSIAEYEVTCRNQKCDVREAAVPLAHIVRLDARVTDAPRTVLFVIGFSIGLLAIMIHASGGILGDGPFE